MPLRSILLAASGGLVLIAIVALFVEVNEAPARPNQAKIDEARQKHKRTRSAPPPAPSDPWSRAVDPTPRLGVEPPSRPRPEPEPEPVRPAPTTAGAAATPSLEGDPRLEISSAKDEANRLYDKMDYPAAMEKALSVLQQQPGDVRMLRVVVSAACQLGEADKAKQYWEQLPPHDQNQMTRRCQRYGITFQ